MNTLGFQGRLKKITPPSGEIALCISGMQGMFCADQVQQILQRLPGVESVFINLELALACVRFAPALATPAMVKQAVIDAGYDVHEPKSH